MRYEAAGTLVTLSSAPTAIKAAASCYIELVVKESDNNVKLIVLDRLIAMKDSPVYERVLQDLVMDILRVLGINNSNKKLIRILHTLEFCILPLLSFILNRITGFGSQDKNLSFSHGFGYNSYDRGNGPAFKEGSTQDSWRRTRGRWQVPPALDTNSPHLFHEVCRRSCYRHSSTNRFSVRE